MALRWETVGPREEERTLAGRVAGVLWLLVIPMVAIAMLLPGSVTEHWKPVAALLAPAAAWGAACLFLVSWERVTSPLFFHVPATLALPYIALLAAWTDVTRSPFTLTILMLLAFAAYFFPPPVAIPYIVSAWAVQALPLLYDEGAADTGLLPDLWVSLFVCGAVGGVIMIGKQQLVALRDAAQELSLKDSLTSLGNRRALSEVFSHHSGGVRREDSLGLLLLDLDDFKEANTLYGFPGGDRVLCAVASAIRSTARGDDLVVRLGGDEFALVVCNVNQAGMKRLGERALQAVRDAVGRLDMPGLGLTASAGWALYPDDADSVDQLMTVADLALRAAKLRGKNCIQSPVDWAPELAS